MLVWGNGIPALSRQLGTVFLNLAYSGWPIVELCANGSKYLRPGSVKQSASDTAKGARFRITYFAGQDKAVPRFYTEKRNGCAAGNGSDGRNTAVDSGFRRRRMPGFCASTNCVELRWIDVEKCIKEWIQDSGELQSHSTNIVSEGRCLCFHLHLPYLLPYVLGCYLPLVGTCRMSILS